MKPEPFINLFTFPDEETQILIKSICCELKVYRSHVDYMLFEELVKKKIEFDGLPFKHMIDNDSWGLFFSPDFSAEEIQFPGPLLYITPMEDQLRLVKKNGDLVVSGVVREKDVAGLYDNRQNYEGMYLCIDWNKQLYPHLRLLMHLSFVMEWNRCRGVVICNYSKNPIEYMIQDVQVFLKGVLNNFSHEEFIFHPFRSRI